MSIRDLFTREAKVAVATVLAVLGLAVGGALVVPVLGVWRAAYDGEAMIVRARAAAEADAIRAKALAETPGARLLLEMRSIEERGR